MVAKLLSNARYAANVLQSWGCANTVPPYERDVSNGSAVDCTAGCNCTTGCESGRKAELGEGGATMEAGTA